MDNNNNETTYLDLTTHTEERTSYFFLNHLLHARIDLHLDTGTHEHDEETNVYLAGLLVTFIATGEGLKSKPYVSPYDGDVRHYLDEHEDTRTEYRVYKDNADFGLVSTAVFLGHEHEGSYFNRVLAGRDESGRIALYYQMAAGALVHLRGNHLALVHTFNSIADHIVNVVKVVRRAAADYFDFIERLSQGSLYHLEKEIDASARHSAYKAKIDGFLKSYTDYTANPSPLSRQRLTAQIEELRALNPDFTFSLE